jgi:hypothetical protein
MHPLREPESEGRLMTLMRDREIAAYTDYLADRGRTRILRYQLPAEPKFVTALSAEILAAVYAMSAEDESVFSDT